MAEKTALVTGGAGFIGSHLAEVLLAAGWELYCLDDVSARSEAKKIHAAIGWQPTMGVDGILADVIAHAGIARDSAVSTA